MYELFFQAEDERQTIFMFLQGINIGGSERCVVECRQNYGQLLGSHKTLSNARHNYHRLNLPFSPSARPQQEKNIAEFALQ